MKYVIYDKTGQTERCTTHKLEYNGEFMGPCSVMCTIKSSEPINFEIGDYLVYRGERFEINYDPSIVKKCSRGFSDEAFIYDSIKFNSLSDELTRCDFLDYVLNDNQIHFTALPRFSFYASSVKDLADRIQANLDRVYQGERKWNVSVNPEFTGKTNVNADISNLNVWEALALAYNTFNAHFVIKGRNITIGTSGMTADHLFQYGKGNGLKEIERQAEQDQLIVTRLRVYGSTKNLPNRYYNKLARPDGSVILPDNMAVQNLMLPGFPITTLDPYVDSRNITKLGIREHTIYFDGSEEGLDEIYPSLESMTAEQLRDAGVNIELDAGDNGKLDEIVSAEQVEDNGILPEEGELKKTFILTLKDIGFDINKYLTTETAVISMKDGACGAREFEIVKCEKKGNKYELTCNRAEDSSIGRVFPYKDYNIKKGDKFVLLHISMPDVYINAASQRMKKASDEWLKKHDFVRYSYFPKVDDIFMARQHDEAVSKGTKSIHDTLKEGDLMLFSDTDLGIDGAVIIDTLNIKEGEGLIPKYSVVLKDEKTVGTIEKIQQAIESIASGGAGGGYNLEQIIAILKNHGAKMFLRKDQPDQTAHLLKLLGGLVVGNSAALLHQGAQFGESFAGGLTGHGGRIDGAGHGELRSLRLWEFLEVPELRYNQVKVFVGIDWQCPGAGIIESVTPDVGESGAVLSTGTAVLKLEEGQFGAIDVDDITMGIYHFGNSQDATADKDDSKGNFAFAGFATAYWRITSVDAAHKTFRYALRPGYSVHPQSQMTFACYGNFTKPERQTSTYRTRTYKRRLWKQNNWEIEKDNIAAQDGDLSNLSVHGLQLQGYSTYLDSIYFTGTIQQLKKPDGTTIQLVNERGKWVKDTRYDYYDRVSHNGSLWLCVNEKGTNAEPLPGNADWLQQVDKGSDGSQGVPGKDGEDGKIFYTWIRYADDAQGNGISNDPTGKDYIGFAYNKEIQQESNNPSDYTWSRYKGEQGLPGLDGLQGEKGEQGIPGTPGKDGRTTYFHVKYSPNANGVPMQETPAAYIGTYVDFTEEDSSDPEMYDWAKFEGIDGKDGANGLPGKNGVDGKTSYLHIAYATSADGSQGFDVSESAGKSYIGQYVDFVEADSTDYRKYKWSLFKGTDGIPGEPGADGKTYYTWVAYSDNANGNPMYQVPHDGTKYIGIAVNKDTREESTNPADYTWSLFKGADGESITNFGPWKSGVTVPKMAVVAMGGNSFLSKKATTNPPMWIFTDAEGNRYITEDGYVLTGECNEAEYTLLAQKGEDGMPGKDGQDGLNGADGVNGTDGTSIVWKGTLEEHPLNPENGWAYRNSTDKKTYIYQDGQWYQMTIDGVDGQNGAPGKDGIGIVWKGDMVSAPANPQKNWVYRDTDNGRVYIYNGTAWELMVVDGSDGQEGAPGQDGLSVYITYHDSVTTPLTPTGNGTTNGWHHNATASVRWMSQKVAASVSEGTWGGPIEIKGQDGAPGKDGVDGQDGKPGPQGPQGDGFTHLGKWKSGMLVPKMGVVTMGGSSYVAKVATRNAPVSVYKDASGNAFIYADGGYVLTGEINTAEYDVLSEKGEDGLQGCIIRDSEWSSAGVQYRNDEALTSDTRFIDIALVESSSNDVGYACYKCKVTHNSNTSNKPGTSGGETYWELMSNVGPIFTSLLIAKNAKIKFLQGNQLLIQKSNGTVAAGISGSDAGDKTRFWAGSNIPDSAPFAVNEEGVATAERFRTGRAGCRMEAHNGVIDIFGDFARNIQFGVNEQGMAVLKYFDNSGNLLYDLGPGGISKIQIREESWVENQWTFLDANISNVFLSKWSTACTPVSGSSVYRYSSKMVAGVLDDAANDGKYFKSKSKLSSNRIANGWYVQTFKKVGGVNGTYVRMVYNMGITGSDVPLPSDMHPENPRISTYETIYFNALFRVSGGEIVERQNIYYNLGGTIL